MGIPTPCVCLKILCVHSLCVCLEKRASPHFDLLSSIHNKLQHTRKTGNGIIASYVDMWSVDNWQSCSIRCPHVNKLLNAAYPCEVDRSFSFFVYLIICINWYKFLGEPYLGCHMHLFAWFYCANRKLFPMVTKPRMSTMPSVVSIPKTLFFWKNFFLDLKWKIEQSDENSKDSYHPAHQTLLLVRYRTLFVLLSSSVIFLISTQHMLASSSTFSDIRNSFFNLS